VRLHDHYDYHVRESPGSEVAFFADKSMDYEQAGRLVNRIADTLIASGFSTSDRVAFLSKNYVEAALFFFGASKASAVPRPLKRVLRDPSWEGHGRRAAGS